MKNFFKNRILSRNQIEAKSLPPSTLRPCPGSYYLDVSRRENGQGDIIAGIEDFHGNPIGTLIVGSMENARGITWITLTDLESKAVGYIAAKGMPVGLCGVKRLNGEGVENSWIHFLGNDLEILAEAMEMIQLELANLELPY